MTTVCLENIVKYYEVDKLIDNQPTAAALDHISLEVKDGETISIVGPSGCGKSTLLKVVAGLEYPNEGCVKYNGFDVTNIKPQFRGVGMVFQDYALYPTREGEGNLRYYFEVRKSTEEEKQQRLKETAELMGMGFEMLLGRMPDTLSGGEKQRVGIARCIVRDPNVFLLDEPISNLDAKLRERTRTEIKRLLQRFGITTLYVTHDQQEAIFMGDRIAIMRQGKLEQFGTFDDLYYSPANLFVATFIGTPPIALIPCQIDDRCVVLKANEEKEIRWELPAEIADKLPPGLVRLGVRPEGWTVGDMNGPGALIKAGHIERLYTERAAFIYGQLADTLVIALVALDYPEIPAVHIVPDWTRAYFFAAEDEQALHTPGAPELF